MREDDAIDLDFLGDESFLEQQQEEIVEDDGARGLKFAFIGAGQAGNNICSQLWSQGYRRVILFNTTEKDLRTNKVPQKYHVVPDGFDGAGKSRKIGCDAAVAASTKIMELAATRFTGSDFIFVVTSAGGGSGSGSAKTLANLAKSYLMQNQGLSESEAMSRVGLIAVLPKPQEASAAADNAKNLIADFVDTSTGRSLGHSPLLFVDNARAESNLPKTISISEVNPTINKIIANLFDMFNTTSARHSEISVFDPKDYASILKSGIVTIGISGMRKVETTADLARQIKANLTNTLLVDKLDLGTGSHAGLIIIAGDEAMATISRQAMNMAQETLTAMLSNGSSSKKVYSHLGVYRQNREQVNVMTIIGGISFPLSRIDNM